jgi:hypothetical protein
MDVIEIAENLRHEPFARGSIRDLLLYALGEAFRTWEEQMEESEERLSQLEAEGEDTSDELDEWLSYYVEYKELLGILAALGGAGGSDPVDPAIDCAAIEKIIQERRKRLFDLPADAASPPLKVVDFSSRRRRGRPAIYSWPDFVARMTCRCMEGPIADQVTLERDMAQWCANNWGSEPSISQIRDWVSPTFKAIQAAAGADRSADN